MIILAQRTPLSKCEMYLYDTNYLFLHLHFCGRDDI